MAPIPDDVDVSALMARAEAEADAIRGRAEVDARATLAAADAEAAAVRGRAEVDARAAMAAAAADRDQARRFLELARRRAEEMLVEAADVRRQTEKLTLDRLLATRADLHDAIERLTEMTEPVLDLTDGGLHVAGETSPDENRVVPLSAVIAQQGPETELASGSSEADSTGDPVRDRVRSAIGLAQAAAADPDHTPTLGSEQPSRRREQLRDGRNLL